MFFAFIAAEQVSYIDLSKAVPILAIWLADVPKDMLEIMDEVNWNHCVVQKAFYCGVVFLSLFVFLKSCVFGQALGTFLLSMMFFDSAATGPICGFPGLLCRLFHQATHFVLNSSVLPCFLRRSALVLSERVPCTCVR